MSSCYSLPFLNALYVGSCSEVFRRRSRDPIGRRGSSGLATLHNHRWQGNFIDIVHYYVPILER